MTSVEGNSALPPLNGLVLAGGRSVRMGADKAAMRWHGKEQRYHLADVLSSLCTNVFISCRADQASAVDPAYNPLPDTYTTGGPLAAILTALEHNAEAAWLVLACDLPLMDVVTLQHLIAARDAGGIATTFKSPHDGLPEPLITIWEPAALEALRQHMSEGFSCPRKALMRNIDRVKIIAPPNPDALLNTNTPEDAERARLLIG